MTYQRYTVRIRPDTGGGYWAEVPAVPGLACFGESLELVTANVRDSREERVGRTRRTNAMTTVDAACFPQGRSSGSKPHAARPPRP